METKPLLFGLIGFLLGGLLVSLVATTTNKPAKHMTDEMTMSQMTESLKELQGDEFDKVFVADMIAHHQAAIDMAKLADGRAKHQEVKDLSAAIIDTQQKEISDMKQWQTSWGYENTANHSHRVH